MRTTNTPKPAPTTGAPKARAGRRAGTQLRLVLPDAAARKGRARQGVRTPRPAVGWGDWRLDATTRRTGRKGVAAARAALEQATTRIAS